jgi:hypothetical protein
MSKKIYALAGMMAILLLVGAGCFVKKETQETPEVAVQQPQEEIVQDREKEATKTVAPAPVKEEPKPVVQKPVETVPAPPPPPPKPEITKCTSLDCLIELAKTCTKGEVIYAYSMPFPLAPDLGITINGKTYYKINGKDTSGLCTLIQQSRGATVILSEEGRQAALERGQTEEEIDDQLKAMNDSFKDPAIVDSVMTCTGAGTDMATYLTNTKLGNFGTSCSISFGEKETRCTVDPNLSCVTRMP